MADPSQARRHPLDAQFEHLQIQWHDNNPHVIVVALNRPQKRNALSRQLWKEIGSAFSTLGRTGDGGRCIILRGAGETFCAGIDLTDPSFLPSSESENVAHTGLTFLDQLSDMQAAFTALEQCPLPIIAAIHGSCIGAGVDLITACDVRLCTSATVFCVKEVAVGLSADVGTLQRLPKIVGNQSWVREVCLSARSIPAEEALQVGLVSRVAASEQELAEMVDKLAGSIAAHSPVAVRGTKQALVYARDHTVEDGLQQIAAFNALALQGPDLMLAWHARGRPAVYPDVPAHSRL